MVLAIASQDKTAQGRTQFPTTGRPHISPIRAKASDHTVEVRRKGHRVAWSNTVMRKEHQALEGRGGNMVGTHPIESSSA